ncbi:M3 family oligoendopeptidase [Halobacillus sp. H74]|uniref:M3 family oligoendopeptidase n=1 Tax=Halobacillus sp. H74 TaxID=3457436 RepID=UPI003FCCBBDE
MRGQKFAATWDLAGIFAVDAPQGNIHTKFEDIFTEVDHLQRQVELIEQTDKINPSEWKAAIESIESIQAGLSQMNSFCTCIRAADTSDKSGDYWRERTTEISVRFDPIVHRVQLSLAEIDDRTWDQLLTKELTEYSFILGEWRREAIKQLSEKEEEVISIFLEEGYHGWGDLYHSIVGDIKLNFRMGGKKEKLSVAQIRNLRSHSDQEVRRSSYHLLQETWKDQSGTLSLILNRITGMNLKLNDKRDIDDPLEESFIHNRMNRKTLQAMWSVVSRYKQPLVKYLNHKAKILGTSTLQAHDFWAPVNNEIETMSYQDGVDFILEHFSKFGTELESFARNAFLQKWVDAEDRSDKSAHAFCAGFPLSGESRISMTYGGHITDTLVLAHELGHAFHNHAMGPVPPLNRNYPMCIAETASTYAEMIVLNAAMKEAESEEQKLFLLDEKLKRSVMNFMEIHTRFLFECQLNETRKIGLVSAKQLNEMMKAALDEGYGGSIAGLSPYAWASTPHFYMTKTHFYNFPYTFGYLFATAIYAKGEAEGGDFERDYIALLEDSGRMTVEDLAKKHLGEDLTKEDFWMKGMEHCMRDVDEFIRISESVHHLR